MAWMQKLCETYDRCFGLPQFEANPLPPLGHTEKDAHIEIVLDGDGSYQRAQLIDEKSARKTLIQATEESAGRTTNCAPHPLCEKLQYCAGDYETFGGKKKPFFDAYIEQLRRWERFGSPRSVQAVSRYLEKRTVIADLVQQGILHCSPQRILLTDWQSDAPLPGIFKMLTAKEGERDQGDAFIRWRVQVPGDPSSAVWENQEVRESWIKFNSSDNAEPGLCMVTGTMSLLATNHPRRVRSDRDGAKLISSNDTAGYTFRGRFRTAGETCGVAAVVTQKAHNALGWLIRRQAHRDGNQAFVAWAVGGSAIPDPLASTASLLDPLETDAESEGSRYLGDAGQFFSLRLKKAVAGYTATLGSFDDVIVMGLDSASDGRIAITYYRELTGAEFLERVRGWHEACAWPQNYSSKQHFIGAPAPRDIAECAYGRRLDDKLRKATVERFLPTVIDARPIPCDVLESCVRRVSNRVAFKQKDHWEWEKCLGVACALFRGSRREENYQMALEEDRTTRDYLFGRLLAIADDIESLALYVAKEHRDTNAAKLMQRFADHPCSTWRNIELSLTPYKTRLRASRPGALFTREKLLDTVICMFKPGDFTSDGKLTGEFLLGYHCQRTALWGKGPAEDNLNSETEQTEANGQQ